MHIIVQLAALFMAGFTNVALWALLAGALAAMWLVKETARTLWVIALRPVIMLAVNRVSKAIADRHWENERAKVHVHTPA